MNQKYSIYYYDPDGEQHRSDGPAEISANGDQEWFDHGLHHNPNGPAVIRKDFEAWLWQAHYHRYDGPAQIDKSDDGRSQWCLGPGYGFRATVAAGVMPGGWLPALWSHFAQHPTGIDGKTVREEP